jgi:hypothetical protein
VPVSELALGTGVFGKTWGDDAEPDEVRSILQGSVEAGGTCIETADKSATKARGMKNALKSISTGISGIASRSVSARKKSTEQMTAMTSNLGVGVSAMRHLQCLSHRRL